MDQGFVASEGFRAPEAATRVAARATTHKPAVSQVPSAPTTANTNDAARQAIGAAELGASRLKKPAKSTLEDKTIAGLENVRRLGSTVWAPGWMTIGSMPLPLPVLPAAGWLATKVKLKNLATAIDMPLKAMTEALGNVTLRTIHTLPSHMMHTAAAVAQESEGKLMQKAAAPLANKAVAVEGFMSGVAKNVGSFTQPLRDGIGSAMTRLGNSGRMGAVISGAASKAMAVAGKTNLFVAVVATAAAAGTAVSFLSANRERKQAKAMLDEIKTQIGADHPVVLAASQKATRRTVTGIVGSLVSTVGEVLGIKMARDTMLVNQAGIMAAQMKLGLVSAGLGMGAGLVVSENDLLTGCTMAMHGELKGDDLAKTYTMMLAQRPLIKRDGKPLNLYRMGHALAERGASFKEVADLVTADNLAFTATVDKINADYAAKAGQPGAAETKPDITPVEGAQVNVVGRPSAANISLQGSEHHGRVTQAAVGAHK